MNNFSTSSKRQKSSGFLTFSGGIEMEQLPKIGQTDCCLQYYGLRLLLAILWAFTQSPITCSKLTIETLEQGVKYVQS